MPSLHENHCNHEHITIALGHLLDLCPNLSAGNLGMMTAHTLNLHSMASWRNFSVVSVCVKMLNAFCKG